MSTKSTWVSQWLWYFQTHCCLHWLKWTMLEMDYGQLKWTMIWGWYMSRVSHDDVDDNVNASRNVYKNVALIFSSFVFYHIPDSFLLLPTKFSFCYSPTLSFNDNAWNTHFPIKKPDQESMSFLYERVCKVYIIIDHERSFSLYLFRASMMEVGKQELCNWCLHQLALRCVAKCLSKS